MLERLDIILLVFGGILMVVSFVLNIIASARMSKLAEGVTQLEAKFETLAKAPAPKDNDSRTGRDSGSRGKKLDSSIFPAPEPPPDDSHSTRYRPPGSRSKKPDESGLSGTGTVSMPPTKHGIGKAGVRLPADTAAHAPETPASVNAENPVSADEARALLKEYLGRETSPAAPLEKMADVREIYGDDNGEGDVMDVVDTRVMGGPAADKPAAPSGVINPFDPKTQRVTFDAVLAASSGLASGGSVTVDFVDIPLLVESEILALRTAVEQLAARGITLDIRNASDDLRATLADLPAITFTDA